MVKIETWRAEWWRQCKPDIRIVTAAAVVRVLALNQWERTAESSRRLQPCGRSYELERITPWGDYYHFPLFMRAGLHFQYHITNSYMPWWSTDLDKQEKNEKGISFSSIYLPIWNSELSIGGLLLAGQRLPVLGHLAEGHRGRRACAWRHL